MSAHTIFLLFPFLCFFPLVTGGSQFPFLQPTTFPQNKSNEKNQTHASVRYFREGFRKLIYKTHLFSFFTEAELPMTSLECRGLYLSVQRTSSKLNPRHEESKINFVLFRGRTKHRRRTNSPSFCETAHLWLWVTGCQILCDWSFQTSGHSCSLRLLSVHFAASVCEYDSTCCSCDAQSLGGLYFPGQAALAGDSSPKQLHALQWNCISAAWTLPRSLRLLVSSSPLSSSAGGLDTGRFPLWKEETQRFRKVKGVDVESDR